MKKSIIAAVTGIMLLAQPVLAKPFAEMFPELVETYPPEAIETLSKIDFKQGKILVGDGLAVFTVPENYYFLDSKDAEYVLHDLWGNPPDGDALGMVFPASATPLDGGNWGLEITFDDIGYVSDEDAEEYDYSDILKTMQEDTVASNKWRRENNYGEITLVGWAERPFYDKKARQLYWAKELKFANEETNTLNYNIRALGRKGVLVMNFISDITILDQVQKAAPDILAMVEFSDGNKYSDFNPSLDKVAAVGIGGLIAGKVLAKTGLLVTFLLIFKKFWFVLFLPLIWVKNKFFGSKSK